MKNPFSRQKSDAALSRRRADGFESGATGPAEGSDRQAEAYGQQAFRRNRTLTGSTSARIRSSNELNAEIRSPRAHVHHLSHHRRKLSFWLASVAIVSILLGVLLMNFAGTTTVAVRGYKVLDGVEGKEYYAALDAYMGMRPMERFLLLLDERAFSRHMQASISSVQTASLTPSGMFGTADLTVTPRKPIARWSDGQKIEYVDDNGVIFNRNYFSSPKLRVVDNSGITQTHAKVVTSQRTLEFVGQLVGAARRFNIRIHTVEIPPLATREIDVRLAERRTIYRLNIDRSVGKQAEDLARTHRYLVGRSIMPEYADLRVEGKAYYR